MSAPAGVRMNLKDVRAKTLDMEFDRGFHISNGFFVRIAFADHDTFDAQRAGDISVRMLFDNDFNFAHSRLLLRKFRTPAARHSH